MRISIEVPDIVAGGLAIAAERYKQPRHALASDALLEWLNAEGCFPDQVASKQRLVAHGRKCDRMRKYHEKAQRLLKAQRAREKKGGK